VSDEPAEREEAETALEKAPLADSSFVERSATEADVASRPSSRVAALTDLEALDQDSPEEVLKTFAVMSIVAAVVCLIPRLFVSAGLLLGLAVMLLLIRRRRLRAGRTS
jgi:hypothetical protein